MFGIKIRPRKEKVQDYTRITRVSPLVSNGNGGEVEYWIQHTEGVEE